MKCSCVECLAKQRSMYLNDDSIVQVPMCRLENAHAAQVQHVATQQQNDASHDAHGLDDGTRPTCSNSAGTSSADTSLQSAANLSSDACEPASNGDVSPTKSDATDRAAGVVSTAMHDQHTVELQALLSSHLETAPAAFQTSDWHVLETAAAAESPADDFLDDLPEWVLAPGEEATPSTSCSHNTSAGSSPTQLVSCLATATSMPSVLPAGCEDSQPFREPMHASNQQAVVPSQAATSCTFASFPQPATHCTLSPSLEAAFSALPADQRPVNSAFPAYQHIQQSAYTRGVSMPPRRCAQEWHICNCTIQAYHASRAAAGGRQSPWLRAGNRAMQVPFAPPAAGLQPASAQSVASGSSLSLEGSQEEQIAAAVATVDRLVECLSVEDSKDEGQRACGLSCLNRCTLVLCDSDSCGYGDLCRNK